MSSFGLRLVIERQSESQRSMGREAPRYPSQSPVLYKNVKSQNSRFPTIFKIIRALEIGFSWNILYPLCWGYQFSDFVSLCNFDLSFFHPYIIDETIMQEHHREMKCSLLILLFENQKARTSRETMLVVDFPYSHSGKLVVLKIYCTMER